MPYELDAERNIIEVDDKLAGMVLELYYRMPTNKERTARENAITKRKGARVVISKDYLTTQAKYGAAVLTGFKKGIFSVGGKIISADPQDPDYYPGWKTMLYQRRPDLLRYVDRTVFSPVDRPDDGGVEFEGAEDLDIEHLDEPDFAFDEGDEQPAAPAEAESADPLSPR